MNEHLRKIQSHATAIETKYRQQLQDTYELMAAPGVRVTLVKKPWPVGEQGVVLGVWEDGARRTARVQLDSGRLLSVPLEALSRRPGGPNCHEAQIQNQAALVKLKGGEFLE